MHAPHDILPETVRIIREGIERGLHTGVQLYVSRSGTPIVDCGIGEARPGIPMTADHISLWLSSGKPLTAVAIARFWEQGRLDLDDRVATHLPEFAQHGKEPITVRHLLTHTGGFRNVETGWPNASWDETIAAICHAPIEADWVPGRTAGYHVASSWFILGELVCRMTGKPFSDALRDEVLEPLGMHDSWSGMPPEVFREVEDRLTFVYSRTGSELQLQPWHTEQRCTAPSPGGNNRGPARELGRFYEMLLNRGRTDGERFLSPQTVEAMTARHRVGRTDETFRHVIDFGLGFLIDSNQYGAETVPYGYGRFCSPRTFGHGGAQSSIGFADPEHQLVVVVVANGMPGEPRHNQRARAINEAIYSDLGLTVEQN